MSHELREAARHPRERMLSAPPLSGLFPDFDVSKSPNVPGPLFADRLAYALDDGLPACHVAMLATADAYGRPSARAVEITAVDLQRTAGRYGRPGRSACSVTGTGAPTSAVSANRGVPRPSPVA